MTDSNTTKGSHTVLAVRVPAPSLEARLIETLVLAFCTDPAARWAWPGPERYLKYFPSFVKAFGGNAFNHGSAYYIDGYAGVALWLPPDVHPDEDTLTVLLRQTTPESIQEDVVAVMEQMGRYHPDEPHWHLPLIGVDPIQQNKGFGSALMQYALIQCDRDRRLAYLESSNPRNIPLYQRHGFVILGTIQVGTSPSIVPMLRKPK